MTPRRSPRIGFDTPLARYRSAANLTQLEALAEADQFIAGGCSIRTWKRMERDPARVPPALLNRFRQLAARKQARAKVKKK